MLKDGQGRYPYNRGDHLIAAIELYAYGDESGIQEGSTYCLLLGYIAPAFVWDSFNDQWRSILNEFQLEELHAIAFFQGRRPYRSWPRSKRRLLLNKLLELINHQNIHPIGWAVDTNDFMALKEEERRYLTGAHLDSHWHIEQISPGEWTTFMRRKFTTSGAKKNAYFMAFNQFVYECYLESRDEASIHVILDNQRVVQEGAVEIFNHVWRKIRHANGNGFDSITYADSRAQPALQAADLYAYVWGRHINSPSESLSEDVIHALNTLASKRKKLLVTDKDYFERKLLELRGDLAAEDTLTQNHAGDLEITFRDGLDS